LAWDKRPSDTCPQNRRHITLEDEDDVSVAAAVPMMT
jgi:hypothetical protein